MIAFSIVKPNIGSISLAEFYSFMEQTCAVTRTFDYTGYLSLSVSVCIYLTSYRELIWTLTRG